jgi:outer membrane protein insertion porin family
MSITFDVAESQRVFVERIDINGNTLTQDKVVRREFRLNEGDAFNSIQVKRTAERIKSLGYFQEDLEVEQAQGSGPDRIVLTTNVEEKATGELSLSAGFSSIENFIFQGSIKQRNFRGLGQELRTNISYSSYSKSAEIGFTEPYLFDRSIALSGDIFRRDLNSFNLINNQRNTTYEQATTGLQIRTGVPVNEFIYFQARYGLSQDDITLDEGSFFTDNNNDGIRGNSADDTCDPLQSGRFLCDAIGNRLTSSIGYTLLYDDRDNRIRPTRGQSFGISQDFAGLGGSVKYIKTRLNADKYWRIGNTNFILGLSLEGGYIHPLENRGSEADGIDDVRLTDRFYLGEPQMRGFDIRGVGPRVQRVTFNAELQSGVVVNVPILDQIQDDALGGRFYYLGRAEVQIPLGSGAKELGLRPSVFVDVGSVFDVTQPILQTLQARSGSTATVPNALLYYTGAADSSGNLLQDTVATNPDGSARTPVLQFQERFLGDSWKPRLSVGFGVNWNSPFGPFRIDIARALLKEEGDDTKLFTFNVGTQF